MVLWLFALLGLVVVVVIGLVVLGRETSRLATAARPAVFEVDEAVEFIADRLPPAAQARLSHDDVRWVLLRDAELLEDVVIEGEVDPDEAVARILAGVEDAGRDIDDTEVVAVLEGRTAYLEAIGAIGPEA